MAVKGAPQSGVKVLVQYSLKRAFVALLLALAIVVGQSALATTAPAYGLTIGGWPIEPGADLSGANLSNAKILAADLTGANLTGANLERADLTGANLTGANLTNANLRNARLSRANLSQANLTNASLMQAFIDGAILKDSNLEGTTLLSAIPEGVTSGGITGTPAHFPTTEWKLIGGYLVGPGASLKGANISGLDLTGANLTNVTSGGTTGGGALLPSGWKLLVGYLVGPGANLTNVNLKGVKLSGVDLTGTNLTGVSSGDITGTPIALRTGYKLVGGYIVGWAVNLTGAKLNGANLSGMSLGYADFTGSELTNANFEGSDLSFANLMDSKLAGVNLTNAKLTNAKLRGVSSGGISGTPSALPTSWTLVGGYLAGDGANLAGANLAGANLAGATLTWVDLTEANLSGANLSGANLTEATLTAVTSGSITGKPSVLPADWHLIAGYLLGPTAVLHNADLRGADLSNINLTGAKFHSAKLSDAKLVDANLTNANFFSADILRADFSGALVTGATFAKASPDFWSIWIQVGDTGRVALQQFNTPTPTMAGVFKVGQTLTAASGTWDDGVTLTYQWMRDDLLISGANKPTYKLTDADIDKFVSVAVTGTKLGFATTTMSSQLVKVEGLDLTLTPEPTVTGTFKVGQTLTATTGTWDEGVTFTYQWIRDSSPISGANKATYKLTDADYAKPLGVAITGSKSGYASATRATPLVSVKGLDLTLTPTPTVTGVFKSGEKVSVSVGTWDPGVTLTMQWMRGDSVITGSVRKDYVLNGFDVGKSVSVAVTASKWGYESVTMKSEAFTVEGRDLTLTPEPTVNGLFKVGQTLTADAGRWDSPEITLSFQWVRNGTAIIGAITENYTLTASDFGKNITVQVTGSTMGYKSVTKTSTPVKVSAAVMTGSAPKISGTAKSGSTLKVTSAAWVKGAKITYQWLSNGAVIKGATSSSLKIAATLKGKKISVKVTQSAPGYTTATKTSATVTVSK